jgi:hypothetical protein
MQNLNYNPYVHFKSPLLYYWCMFIEIYWNSPLNKKKLFKLVFIIHKYFFQIDDFTTRLWHLNRVYFVESP